jgi:hypothetical protein
MHLKTIACKNCNNQFEGKFCNNCGQKASVGTINFKDIFHEGWHNLTHTDKGYLQLFWDLLVRPAQTIKNYLAGQRKRYFSPFTFYIVTTSLLILVTHWVFKKEDAELKVYNEIGNYLAQSLNYILMPTLPVVAVLLWLFFKRNFKNFAEAFVLSVFAFGALNFFLLICTILFYFFIKLHQHYNDYAVLVGYLFMFYIFFSFFKPLKTWGVIKLILLTICFYFLVETVAKDLLLLYYGVPFEQLNPF